MRIDAGEHITQIWDALNRGKVIISTRTPMPLFASRALRVVRDCCSPRQGIAGASKAS